MLVFWTCNLFGRNCIANDMLVSFLLKGYNPVLFLWILNFLYVVLCLWILNFLLALYHLVYVLESVPFEIMQEYARKLLFWLSLVDLCLLSLEGLPLLVGFFRKLLSILVWMTSMPIFVLNRTPYEHCFYLLLLRKIIVLFFLLEVMDWELELGPGPSSWAVGCGEETDGKRIMICILMSIHNPLRLLLIKEENNVSCLLSFRFPPCRSPWILVKVQTLRLKISVMFSNH